MNKRFKKWLLAAITGLGVSSIAMPTYAASYQVQPNDTFWTIAKANQIPLDSLLSLNKQLNPLNLQTGQTIQLPDKPGASSVTKTVPEYSKLINATSSAYTADPAENGGWGAVDYFGNPLKLGTVAVDPSVIPLGSSLYIEGYSYQGLPEGGMYAKAADMGGAIKGNRVDIYVPGSANLARSYGFQTVKVYVLK